MCSLERVEYSGLFRSAVAGESNVEDLIVLFDRNANFFGKDFAGKVFDFVDFEVGVQGRIRLNLIAGLFGGGVDLNNFLAGGNVGFKFPVDNSATVVLSLSVGGLKDERAGVDGFSGDGNRSGNVDFFGPLLQPVARQTQATIATRAIRRLFFMIESLNVN